MNGMEKLIAVIRKEGARGNPPPLVLGEMADEKTADIAGNRFSFGDGDLYVAEHLLERTAEVTFPDTRTEDAAGGSGEDAFASHAHDIRGGRRTVTVHSPLGAGDLVLCYRIEDDKYVIIEKVVSR